MEIILYDVVLPKLFCFPYLLKSYVFCFYSFHEIETIRPCVYVYTLHTSDEVVSLLISGCEKSCNSIVAHQWLLLHSMCYY